MPVALERKLRREANKKGIKDKDAYVYGTLRKTGWKPSTQKKMSADSRLLRLGEINKILDPIIEFAYNDDDRQRSALGTAGLAAGAVGVGAAGTLGHQAIQRTGGYAANLAGAKTAFGLERRGVGAFMNTPSGVQARSPAMSGQLGYRIGSTVGNPKRALLNAPEAIGKGTTSALGKIFNPGIIARIGGLFHAESKTQPVRFDEHILEPFAEMPPTKITQEEFPAGPNPDYAAWAKNLSREEVLKLPFPELMKFLNARNILQQQFPGFSLKAARLMELNSMADQLIRFRVFSDEEREKLRHRFSEDQIDQLQEAYTRGEGIGTQLRNAGSTAGTVKSVLFQAYDEDRLAGSWVAPAAGVGVGAGGVLAHKAIMKRGGYRAVFGGGSQPQSPPAAAQAAARPAINPAVSRPAAVASTMGRPVATQAATRPVAAAASGVRDIAGRPAALGSTMERIGARWAKVMGGRAPRAILAALESKNRLVRLSRINSQVDELIQFQFKPKKKGNWKEEDEKKKKPFQRGHRSHGGGT